MFNARFRNGFTVPRLIVNCDGLFFKAGRWTPLINEATVFPTLKSALQARHRFCLEHIQLVEKPKSDDWLSSN